MRAATPEIPPTPESVSDNPLLLSTAIEAVVRAGDVMRARFGGDVRVDKKGQIDLVTEVDIAIEREFRAMIGGRFPDHAILGEELGGSATVPPGPCWIFDPIDGTTNYAHGLPIYCSSLGLEVDGEVVVAAIYDPSRQELFTAEKGEGAWLNGDPLRVSATDRLIDSLLVTGFPYDVRLRQEELIAIFAAFLTEARAVRRLGSAAVDLCYVAAGRFDGFWEQHLKPWDVAAGSLIVTEAGGRMSRMDGTAFSVEAGSLLASNGCLHGGMVRLIAAVQTTELPRVDLVGAIGDADASVIDRQAFDASGRFIMPTMLRERARIADLAFFIGTGDTFEIWNPRLLIETPDIDEELKEVVAALLKSRGAA